MPFGAAIGTACATFALTNIDDIFVLATFFFEATTSRTLTPFKIVLGQYIGFTVIVLISLIGFAVAQALPSEPIGFLGLLPILLGFWKALEVLIPIDESDQSSSKGAHIMSAAKVAAVTVMNGGDNIGTYVPLFAQVKSAEIAVYVVTYYILLGVWCAVALVVMRQQCVLQIVSRYAQWFMPLLYMGLGTFIVVKSDCFPWTIERINVVTVSQTKGLAILAPITAAVLLTGILGMLYLRLRMRGYSIANTTDVSSLLSRRSGDHADSQELSSRAQSLSELESPVNHPVHNVTHARLNDRLAPRADSVRRWSDSAIITRPSETEQTRQSPKRTLSRSSAETMSKG